MKENDPLSLLLRDRLSAAQMDVRPGFWEDLQRDLAAAESPSEAVASASEAMMSAPEALKSEADRSVSEAVASPSTAGASVSTAGMSVPTADVSTSTADASTTTDDASATTAGASTWVASASSSVAAGHRLSTVGGGLSTVGDRRSVVGGRRRSFALRRWAAAAAVLMVLGIAGLLVWQLPQRRSIQAALSPAQSGLDDPAALSGQSGGPTPLPSPHLAADASSTPTVIDADPLPSRQPRQHVSGTPSGLSVASPSGSHHSSAGSYWLSSSLGWARKSGLVDAGLPADDDERLTLRITVTITERLFSPDRQSAYGYSEFALRNGYAYPWLPPGQLTGEGLVTPTGADGSASAYLEATADPPTAVSPLDLSPWSWRIGLGTALPRGDYHAPLTVEIAVERRLGRVCIVSAGIQYNYLGTSATAAAEVTNSAATTETTSADVLASPADLHLLAIPVRLQARLAGGDRLELYAYAGGAVEKSVNKGWRDDPVRLSIAAGLGVSYRMGNRLALFAEPAVTHCFDTDTRVQSLRTERPTNLGLLCGLRVVY